MQKIKSLFERDYEGNRQVINKVVEGSEWVINGEGIATQKFDGTCCMIKEGKLYKRYDAKNGKTPPEGFIPAQEPDPITGHWPGWLEVTWQDKWHIQAIEHYLDITDSQPSIIKGTLLDGTYELIGPKINGNKNKVDKHMLVRHGYVPVEDALRTYEELKEWFKDKDIEGIVWHHPDGRMVKVKKKDFGYKW